MAARKKSTKSTKPTGSENFLASAREPKAKILMPIAKDWTQISRQLIRAFSEIGCEIRYTVPNADLAVDKLSVWVLSVADGQHRTGWDDWKPDVILFSDHRHMFRHPLYKDVPHIVYAADNHKINYEKLFPEADFFFLAHPKGYYQPWEEGSKNSAVLWHGCSTDDHAYLSGTTWDKRVHNIVAWYSIDEPQFSHKRNIIHELLDLEIPVLSMSGELFESWKVVGQKARIALVFSSNNSIPRQIFEFALAGCVVFSDVPTDTFQEGYDNGIVYTKTVEDIVKQYQHICSHNQHRSDLIKKSRAWAEQQTWNNRAEVIIRHVKPDIVLYEQTARILEE